MVCGANLEVADCAAKAFAGKVCGFLDSAAVCCAASPMSSSPGVGLWAFDARALRFGKLASGKIGMVWIEQSWKYGWLKDGPPGKSFDSGARCGMVPAALMSV
jgi:hypothetical protein